MSLAQAHCIKDSVLVDSNFNTDEFINTSEGKKA